MKKLIVIIVCTMLLTACQNENKNKEKDTTIEISTRTPNSIVGTWYELKGTDYIKSWYFGEDRSYELIYDLDGDISNYSGSYVIEDNIVTMIDNYGKEEGSYRIKYTDYGIKLMYAKEAGRPIELYENKQQLLETNPDYYTSRTYYKTIADDDGFVIKDGILIEYVGEAEAITIPTDVKSIGSGALWGKNLEKITFPDTLQIIQSGIFGGEPEVHYVYIEDGVKEIEDRAFWDIYLLELHIPASVSKIGKDIIGVEDGAFFEHVKIFVEEDSYAYKYFVEEGLEDRLVIEKSGNGFLDVIMNNKSVFVIVIVLIVSFGISVLLTIWVRNKRK